MSSISSESSSSAPGGPAPRKKRVRHWTSNDRARHRVIEKERREAFNERLLELARLLPALHGCKQSQLSKHVIVHESIQQHNSHRDAAAKAEQELAAIRAERDSLRAEVNQWRMLNCVDPWPLTVHDGDIAGRTPAHPASIPVDISPAAAQHPSMLQYAARQPMNQMPYAFHSLDLERHIPIQPPSHMDVAVAESAQYQPVSIRGPNRDTPRPSPLLNDFSRIDFYMQPSMEPGLPYPTPT